MITSHMVVTPASVIKRSSDLPFFKDIASFEKVTGIKNTRHYPGTATQLAVEAVQTHADHFGYPGIGALIVATQSASRSSPCMAMDVHKELKLPRFIPCFDINQSCDGFLYGLWLSAKMGSAVMLVCVDQLRARPDTVESLIFSDAASVTVIDGSLGFDTPEFMTDPSGIPFLCSDSKGLLQMDGGAVFDFVTTQIPPCIKRYQQRFPCEFLVQHQANLSMMKLVDKRSEFPEEDSLKCIEDFGNMSMVSIPMALAIHEKKILGKRVMLCGYGAGWCSAIMGVYWPSDEVSKVVLI